MTEEKALISREQKQILFYEDQITAVVVESGVSQQIFVPLRPICDALGLSWSGQRDRIARDAVLSEVVTGVRVTRTPDQGGSQEMLCIPLDYLNGWLFGISASRVKDEIRDRLIRYQRECYRVLADAFKRGELSTEDPTFSELLQQDSDAVQAYKMALAVVKLAQNQILLESRLDSHEKELVDYGARIEQIESQLGQPDRSVTPEQASQISQAVKTVAIAMGKKTKRNEFGAVYGELYRKFGITSYKMLPANKFEEAMKFLTDWHQNMVGDDPF